MSSDNFTHLDSSNNPQMVDVGEKKPSKRFAHARSIISAPIEVTNNFSDGELHSKKGPVFQTAIIAGNMAIKKTAELIPLCHNITLDSCKIEISLAKNPDDQEEIIVDSYVSTESKTGVEMEALTGATIAALTIYDMCKAISKGIIIKDTKLIKKSGGKSDYCAPKL